MENMDRILNYLPLFRWTVGALLVLAVALLVTSQVWDRTATETEPVTLPAPTETRAAQALMPTFTPTSTPPTQEDVLPIAAVTEVAVTEVATAENVAVDRVIEVATVDVAVVEQPTPTAVSTAAPTPQPSPTAPLPPRGQLEEAAHLHRLGYYAEEQALLAAILADAGSSAEQKLEARYRLVESYLSEDNFNQALATLELFEADTATLPADDPRRLDATFLRGEALGGLGRADEAAAAYTAFLEAYPSLSLAIFELIGETYEAVGNPSAAADAYGRAAAAAADNSTLAGLLERQGAMLETAGRWANAAAVYDQILSFAVNPSYRTTIGTRAGSAHAEAGNGAEAVARWQAVLTEQGPSAAAHPALAALVERGVAVDLFLRGSINLANGSTIPAISAFDSFITENPADPRVGEALHGIGQSHLELGNFTEAQAFFERVLAEYPSCACFGQVKLDQARLAILSGNDTEGRRIYRTFAREFPNDGLAAEALWRSALSAISADNQIEAAVDFFSLVDGFPNSERAPRALYVLGIGSMTNRLYPQAVLSFSRLQNEYPDATPQAAAYWLGRAYAAQGDTANATAQWQALVDREPDTYFGVLAGQALLDRNHNTAIFRNVPALSNPASTLPGDDGSQSFAERWLAERIGVDASTLATLPAAVANDTDLRNGEMLLRLDRRGEALALLQRVANRYSEDAHALYALALHFEDLGTYGLAINVSTRLISMSGAPLVEDTPSFLQRISYPIHFEELVEREAAEFDIDPLLFYSLIRQESLFEEGARSYAAAQGLAQIIPATGAEIAGRLNFPNYSNDLIYRPHINVRFGVFYLDWVRDYVNGSIPAALAGYNAGPGNSRTWQGLAGGDEALFVELMTFSEPRLYIQRILSHYYHYNRLYR